MALVNIPYEELSTEKIYHWQYRLAEEMWFLCDWSKKKKRGGVCKATSHNWFYTLKNFSYKNNTLILNKFLWIIFVFTSLKSNKNLGYFVKSRLRNISCLLEQLENNLRQTL